MKRENIETHIYEISDPRFEYLVRINGKYSYQEFQILGKDLEEFLNHADRTGYDIFVYKLVQSYEEYED